VARFVRGMLSNSPAIRQLKKKTVKIVAYMTILNIKE
jgi:hypothetical protein